MLFNESLAGVINWSIAAWLFAINKVFMLALFEKHRAPIKFFFSRAGLAQLIEHMIYVLRWGLWMSPIIFTFLRMMPDPTWYNQDGAIRTIFAIYNNLTMSDGAFREWSLNFFVYILAFDILRVLIWIDHMGLRVATLVNLSFIGLDRLDEKVARFIKVGTAQRYIPEAVKRFCTWGPLLIPFYIPRGEEWNYAWNKSQSIRNAARRLDLLALINRFTKEELLLFVILAVLAASTISFLIRLLRRRSRKTFLKTGHLSNKSGYRVYLREDGEIYSEFDHKKRWVYPLEYDISRRSYDIIDPSGRVLYILDSDKDPGSENRYWPVVGNFPKDEFKPSKTKICEDSFKITNTNSEIQTIVDISLPEEGSALELWKITLRNLGSSKRRIKIVPYLEWVLNGGLHDRFHTQYARLFPELQYLSDSNALLSWQRSTKCMGILASDIPAEGILFSRIDFIGRAQSIWKPRVLDTLDFMPPETTDLYPTFDPIGSLMIDAELAPESSKTVNILMGCAADSKSALDLVSRNLKIEKNSSASKIKNKKNVLIGHGDILPGTVQPYYRYSDNGNKIIINTPYTTRPYDHAMSNRLGHSVMVTNRGLHTSCNGNSQQNRLTPDWPDIVTKEIPSEAIYLYDPDKGKWYSPTYHPLNNRNAKYSSEFGVDGTAVFKMEDGDISTGLTIFVP
ncbi:MAG TPA: hypothetical protein ENN78_02030, partial [Candidatus Omnitrophica bacterium]|nr:hypothetical protein [Candidatus Omnitrophota bacterium]